MIKEAAAVNVVTDEKVIWTIWWWEGGGKVYLGSSIHCAVVEGLMALPACTDHL